MRIFYVTNARDAKDIAYYLINSRLAVQISYTFPDRIKGPARFVFKLMRHNADNPQEMSMLTDFLEKSGITVYPDSSV